MIRQLKKRVILITMGVVIFVLFLLMGSINIANYVQKDKKAEQVLNVLLENEGHFPTEGKLAAEEKRLAENVDRPVEMPPEKTEERKGFTPETPYEIRFFSVELGENGELIKANTGKIAAISTEDAVEMAADLWEEGKTKGYCGRYKFASKTTKEGELYQFLDCTRDLDSVKEFLQNSLLVSLLGLAAVFALVLCLSGKIVHPIVESYEKQKTFITNAGHEIKTPLAVIDSCIDVLELEQGENKWTDGVRTQVERLNTLTQDLVALARMEEAAAKTEKEEFSFSEMAEDTMEAFELLAQNRKLAFHLIVQPGVTYYGNRRMLQQLCSILADNAVKYADEQGRIQFTLAQKGKKIQLVCENTAEGLTKGNHKEMLERFYRGDASRSSEKPGYGIGLSMAQSIVAAHGGRIEVKSPDGKKLVVTVLL